jgi:hypothetical protein
MYISKLAVDGLYLDLTRIFDPASYEMGGVGELGFKRDEKINPEANSISFSPEPAFWVDGAGTASVTHVRGRGAMVGIQGGNDAILLNLNPFVAVPSVLDRDYCPTLRKVSAQPNSVAAKLKGRSFWGNVEDDVKAPTIGKGTEADYSAFVKKGRHAHGAAARVLAVALEHALAPIPGRLRVRNAAECYWCLGRYRTDGIVYSMQNTAAASRWSSPTLVGRENDPTCSLWVGSAQKTKGMALFSRLYDAGGPFYGHRSHLLSQFDEGSLMMAGTGVLRDELPNVQSHNFWEAIREALWILVVYNNVEVEWLEKMLHVLIHNLPMVDASYYREREGLYWRTRENEFGYLDISEDAQARLTAELDLRLGPDFAQAWLGDGLDPVICSTVLSSVAANTLRDTVLAPTAGGGDWAPAQVHLAHWRVAAALGRLGQAHNANIRGEQVYFANYDLTAMPDIPNWRPPTHAQLTSHYPALSGRAAYRLFMYSGDAVAGIIAPVPGTQVVALADVVALGLQVHTPPGGQGQWLEWIGGAGAGGAAHNVPENLRVYVVRSFLPITVEQYANGFTAPVGHCRRFEPGPTRRWD